MTYLLEKNGNEKDKNNISELARQKNKKKNTFFLKDGTTTLIFFTTF